MKFFTRKTKINVPRISSRNTGMFFGIQKIPQAITHNLKRSFRKVGQAWVNGKLRRMRSKILKTENSRFHLEKPEELNLYTRRRLASSSTHRSGPAVDVAERFFKGLKGMKGKVMLRKAFALITIFAVIVTAYWQNNQTANGATWTL